MTTTPIGAAATGLPEISDLMADLTQLQAGWLDAGDCEESYRFARLHQSLITTLAVTPCKTLADIATKITVFWDSGLPGTDAARQQILADLERMGA